MTIIEKLVYKERVSDEDIMNELYEICCTEHSSCNDYCPVFAVDNKTAGDCEEDCTCFKSGRGMLKYMRTFGGRR